MDPRFRLDAFTAGACMVTNDIDALGSVINTVALEGTRGGALSCPGGCGIHGLTEDELHEHYPLYHAGEPNMSPACPICGEIPDLRSGGMDVHIQNMHGPPQKREPLPAKYGAFAWVVCRRADG